MADFNKQLPSPPKSEAASIIEPKESLWRKVFRLGIPLDFWARFIIILGFCEAVMAAWGGMQIIISGRLNYGKIWFVMTIVLLSWGAFFIAAGYLGFSILWGRWSCSPTALRIMRLVVTLLTILYGTAAGLWFFYGIQSATATREVCVTTLVFLDGETVPAPQAWVDLCLRTAESFERLQMAWGFMNSFQVYFMMILAQWTGQHERALSQQKRWSRNSGLTYSESDNRSFDKLSDLESNSHASDHFEKMVAQKVEEFALNEKLVEKQPPHTLNTGMSIPNFPMPNNTRTRLAVLQNTPSPILEANEDAIRLRESDYPRFSGVSAMSGAIPIALDLRNLNSPRFYGRAF
ncbi:hypothetical protein ABW20_dc0105784 [Dactylellina cionopaga]|nr:hypothetical protein ABW20_dc0105784 [Dactylellina cionopaga]